MSYIFFCRVTAQLYISARIVQWHRGLKNPAFGAAKASSLHTSVARSIDDALYRGDAVGAKRSFVDCGHDSLAVPIRNAVAAILTLPGESSAAKGRIHVIPTCRDTRVRSTAG